MRLIKTNWLRTSAIALLALVILPAAARAITMNIEIDYMVLRDQNNNILHSHKPTTSEINAVVQMFACHGITLNVVVDDEIPHVNVIPQNPDNKKTIFGTNFTANSFYLMKLAYFDHTSGPWHYCIFGHQYQINDAATGSSGLSEIGGDDLVVTLGTFNNQIGTAFDRASTLAHEFGHNLGLTHCGNMDCSVVGPGPILMPSTMSYNFQLDGVRTNLLCLGLVPASVNLFKEIDYSNGRMCALLESSLDETQGTGMISVDWDCDGSIGGSDSRDLDNVYKNDTWCGAGSGTTIWFDYNEWANIFDFTQLSTKAQRDAVVHDVEPCMTSDEFYAKQQKDVQGACAQPTLATENCVGGQIEFISTSGNLPADGRCVDAYPNLTIAAPAIPNNSAVYILPGTYTEPGADLIVTKPMIVTSAGGALITTASAPNVATADDDADSTAVQTDALNGSGKKD